MDIKINGLKKCTTEKIVSETEKKIKISVTPPPASYCRQRSLGRLGKLFSAHPGELDLSESRSGLGTIASQSD